MGASVKSAEIAAIGAVRERIMAISDRVSVRYLKIAAAILVVIVSGLVPRVLPDWSLRLIPVAAVGLCVTVAAVGRPFLALIAGLPIAFFVNAGLKTGSESPLNASILWAAWLLAILAINVLAGKSKLSALANRSGAVLAAILALSAVSLLAGQLEYFDFVNHAPMSAQLGGLGILWLSVAVMIASWTSISSQRLLKMLVYGFLFLSSARLLVGALPFVPSALRSLFVAGSGGSLFWVWHASLATALAVYDRQSPRWLKYLLGATVLLSLGIGFFPGRSWASGWLPPLAAALVVLFIGARRLAFWASTLASLLMLANFNTLYAILSVGDQPYSLRTRLTAWQIMAKIIAANPWLGLGPSNYYWSTSQYLFYGFQVVFSSHNQYIDIVAQYGLVGLALFLLLWIRLLVKGLSVSKRIPDSFERAFAIGATGGIFGSLVAGFLGDWLLPFVYNVGLAGFRSSYLLWLFGGALLAVVHRCRDIDATHSADGAAGG